MKEGREREKRERKGGWKCKGGEEDDEDEERREEEEGRGR